MITTVERFSWVRSNRWWLIGLPIALVLAVGSAAYRVNDLWYENGWHHELATVDQGKFVSTKHTVYGFDEKPKPVGMRMRLGAVTRTDAMYDGLGESLPLPAGMVGVKLWLDFRAVGGKPAPYCTVYILDRAGNRYEVEELDGGSNPCPPPGGSPDDPKAPSSWTRSVSAALPKSAKVTDVWVGVSWPDYIRFRLTTPQRAGTLKVEAD